MEVVVDRLRRPTIVRRPGSKGVEDEDWLLVVDLVGVLDGARCSECVCVSQFTL